MSVTRKAWELQIGDRVLGTDLVIASRYTYSEHDRGGDVERQRYTYETTNGKSLTYAGDSRAFVIPNTEPLEG